MGAHEWLEGDEDDADEDEEAEAAYVGESSEGRCPWCGISPVFADDAGGGVCGHYLALYDCWTEKMDAANLPALPRLDERWLSASANLFPITQNERGENVFSPSALLAESFGADSPTLNAWAGEGLCAAPNWDETTRDTLLTEVNGVQAIGYATGVVYYAADLGTCLEAAVHRLAAGFDKLTALLDGGDGSESERRTTNAA